MTENPVWKKEKEHRNDRNTYSRKGAAFHRKCGNGLQWNPGGGWNSAGISERQDPESGPESECLYSDGRYLWNGEKTVSGPGDYGENLSQRRCRTLQRRNCKITGRTDRLHWKRI